MPKQSTLAEVRHQINQVRRRETVQVAQRAWPVLLASALLFATAWQILQSYLGLGVGWEIIVSVVLMVTLTGTLALAWWRRPNNLDAALTLDQRCGLQERVVTLMTLDTQQQATPAGLALLEDTQAILANVRVAERFPLRQSPRSLAAPVLALALLCFALYFPWPVAPAAAQQARAAQQATTAPEVTLNLTDLKERNEERRERIKDVPSENLQALQQDIDKLFQQLDSVKDEKQLQRAVQDTTKLQEAMRQRQEQLQSGENVFNQMRKAFGQEKPENPANALDKALAEGDFAGAKEELKKLTDKLQSAQLTPEQRRQTQERLNQLQQQLDQVAFQRDRQEALEKSAMDPETKSREKAKLDQDLQQLKDLQDLAKKMQDFNQAMQQNDPQSTRQAQQQMSAQLDKMEGQQKELDELARALQDMQDLRQCLG